MENIITGTDNIYVMLYHGTGGEAASYIAQIQKRGAKDVLESMLVNLPLDGREIAKMKPWGMFSDTFTLGDYTLWWNIKGPDVYIFEAVDLNDPYSNE
jgi:hypothetical protein